MSRRSKILLVSILLNVVLAGYGSVLLFQRDIFVNDKIVVHNEANYPSMNTASLAKRNQIVVDVYAHFPSLVTFASDQTWYQINDYVHRQYKLSLPLILWNPFMLRSPTKLNSMTNKLLSIKDQIKVRVNNFSMKDIKQYWNVDNLNGETRWQTYLSLLKTDALKRWTPNLVNGLINQLK